MEKVEFQKIGIISFPTEFIFNLSVILIYEPLSDIKYKIYRTLNPSEKAGMLSRHLMSIAKKYGFSDDYLGIFLNIKKEYNFYKRIYPTSKNPLNSKGEKKNIKELIDGLKIETKYYHTQYMLVTETLSLITKIMKHPTWHLKVIEVNEKNKTADKTML